MITGSNGAGKSSVGFSYLPQDIQDNYNIFDGDKLFLQKRKELYPKKICDLKEAKAAADEWVLQHFISLAEAALQANDHFVYEGHFIEEENWRYPRKFKEAGYKIHLVFFGLTDTNLSALRVFDRAKFGGHNVSPYDIEKNFYGNLTMVNRHFALIDDLQIIDTSELNHKALAHFKEGKLDFTVPSFSLPDWFQEGFPALFEIIVAAEANIKE